MSSITNDFDRNDMEWAKFAEELEAEMAQVVTPAEPEIVTERKRQSDAFKVASDALKASYKNKEAVLQLVQPLLSRFTKSESQEEKDRLSAEMKSIYESHGLDFLDPEGKKEKTEFDLHINAFRSVYGLKKEKIEVINQVSITLPAAAEVPKKVEKTTAFPVNVPVLSRASLAPAQPISLLNGNLLSGDLLSGSLLIGSLLSRSAKK